MILGDEHAQRMNVLLAPPLVCVDEKLTKGAGNDAQVGSRCAPLPARQVMNADFPVGAASTFQLVEQLGIDHRSRVSSGCWGRELVRKKLKAQSMSRTCMPRTFLIRNFQPHALKVRIHVP